jgi:hypothetical protein
MRKSLGSVGDLIHASCVGADGEDEACAEGVRRAQEIAEIDGLRNALNADGEIPRAVAGWASRVVYAISGGLIAGPGKRCQHKREGK